MSRVIGTMLIFATLVFAATASADSIHLEVSPAEPSRGTTWTITATGASSPSERLVVLAVEKSAIASLAPIEACPASDGAIEEWERPNPAWVEVAAPNYTNAFTFAPIEGSPVTSHTLVCAYLSVVQLRSPPSITLVASAELKVKLGPSAAEAKEKYEAEAPAREAAQHAATVAREEAEAAKARVLALSKPVGLLVVTPLYNYLSSSREPGDTELYVSTSPYAYVTITLSVRGKHVTVPVEAEAYGKEALPIHWSCKRPGLTYRYTVSAHTDVGPTLTRRGVLRTVSAARCRFLKRREAEVRERKERATERRQADHERQEREAHDKLLHEQEVNCQNEGGVKTFIELYGERYFACRNPNGGFLPVYPPGH
jgi:hypothetical protein